MWSWILMFAGLPGLYLAGRKVWWAWYVSLAVQVLWLAYAISTKQYGFIVSAVLYAYVYARNGLKWTGEK